MFTRCLLAILLGSVSTAALAQDINSGPPAGQAVPELKVHVVSGPDNPGETVDVAAQRGDKVTVYAFVPAGKFSRQVHGFLKALGPALQKQHERGQVVAVWLTDDQDKTRNYLPKIANYYEAGVSLTVYPGEAAGPPDWAINDLATVTVVVADRGRVVARLGYDSVNDTVVREVLNTLKKKDG